ncbi:MAG: hypothetical protein ACYCTB_03110 [bacterium]
MENKEYTQEEKRIDPKDLGLESLFRSCPDAKANEELNKVR